jgi:hypothetical protein
MSRKQLSRCIAVQSSSSAPVGRDVGNKLATACAVAALWSCWSPAAAQDPSTIIVPYSSSSNRTLGDAVNIAFPYNPLGRCVSYQAADLVWDTGGAISSEGKFDIALVEAEEKRTTNIGLGLQTAGKIKYGAFNANSSFDANFTKESFRHNQAKTITLKFTASADHGRRMIQNYKADSTAPLPAPDLVKYREICGTHFIRGERRASDLTILIRISTSSQTGKDALTTTLKKTIGGGVSLKAVSGEAGATFTTSYKSIIEYAKKAGDVSVDYRAHGGPGIAAAGTAAKVIDPADFPKLSEIASNVSNLFNQDNSGITGYVLHANTALGAPEISFDLARIEQIGALTRKLMMLNDATTRYDEVKAKNAAAYDKYFQKYGNIVNVARAELVQLINTCAAGGSCVPPAKDILQELNFLEDMFAKADVSLSCQYQPASSIRPVLSTPTVDPLVLESLSINVMGTSHHPDLIDFTSTNVIKLGVDNVIEDVTPRFSGFELSPPTKENQRRVFGTVYAENINPATAITYDNEARKFGIDTGDLQRRRDSILGSAFSIFAPGPNGLKISHDIGFPPRDNCPVIRTQ